MASQRPQRRQVSASFASESAPGGRSGGGPGGPHAAGPPADVIGGLPTLSPHDFVDLDPRVQEALTAYEKWLDAQRAWKRIPGTSAALVFDPA